MAIRRVPGSKSYMADDSGLKDFGTSKAVGDATFAAAKRLAGNAQAVGSGTYEAAPATVTVGFANELRSGAVVREKAPAYKDARDSILRRVIDAMRAGQG